MKAPDKIYVRQYRDGDTSWFWDDEPYEDEIAGIEAVEYIRKEALLEWANKHLEQYVKLQYAKHQDPVYWGMRNAFQQVIDKLNSM